MLGSQWRFAVTVLAAAGTLFVFYQPHRNLEKTVATLSQTVVSMETGVTKDLNTMQEGVDKGFTSMQAGFTKDLNTMQEGVDKGFKSMQAGFTKDVNTMEANMNKQNELLLATMKERNTKMDKQNELLQAKVEHIHTVSHVAVLLGTAIASWLASNAINHSK